MGLRLIYDNAADRATITASTTAGSLVAANMQTDIKSSVWRSTGTTETITLVWSSAEIVSGVVLPFCNFTSAATIRARGYTNVADSSPIFDTGTILACPAVPLGLWNWGALPLGVNSFSYGGGKYARDWIANPASIKKLVIDVADVTNASGYLEVGRAVVGSYWESELNTETAESSSTTIGVVDTTQQYRTDAGDLMSDIGTKHRHQVINLGSMDATDRQQMWNLMIGSGLSKPFLISLYPDNTDSQLEEIHQMYCKIVATPEMGIPYYNKYAIQLEMEEV